MAANSFGTWLKRWGLLILVIIATVVWLISVFLPAKKKSNGVVRKAKDDLKKIRDDAIFKHEVHKEKMQKARFDLDKIKAIADKEDRKKRLVEFANRRSVR